MKIRHYQKPLINGVIRKIGEGFRTILAQSPTGSGKTVMFVYLLTRYFVKYPTHRVTILVHREELQQQTLKTIGFFGLLANVNIEMIETFINRTKKKYTHSELIIIDECHIGNHFKAFEYYNNSLIIGFSATPISSNKKKPLKGFFETIVQGCQIVELIKFNSVDNNEGLVPCVIYAPDTSLDKKAIKKTGGEFNLGDMGREFSKPKLVQAVLDSYRKYCDNEKTIIFNSSIEHSLIILNLFRDAGYPVRHLDGVTPKEDRREILRWFNLTPGAILCNVGVATTGFDEPGIINVIVNRCTQSLALWLQMTGRGSRPFYDTVTNQFKKFFRIIDLGENHVIHGSWSQNRDWVQMFNNPPKPGDGTAPVKECPKCEALIPMSSMLCEYCGHAIVKETKYSDGAVNVVLVEDLYKKAVSTGKKSNWVLYEAAKKIKTESEFMQAVDTFYTKENRYCSKQDANYWLKQFRNANNKLSVTIG